MKEFDNCSRTISTHCDSLQGDTKHLLTSLKDLAKSTAEQVTNLHSSVDRFASDQTVLISGQSSYIDAQISKLQTSLQTIMSRENDSQECVALVQSALQEIQNRLAGEYMEWTLSLSGATERLCSDIEASSSVQHNAVCHSSLFSDFTF